MSKYTILDKINTPADLKLVPEGQLKELASELRTFGRHIGCEWWTFCK